MAKTKERIIPPAKKVVGGAAHKLPKSRSSEDARILAEKSVAKRQGARRPSKKP
jgi:hypothetical protein